MKTEILKNKKIQDKQNPPKKLVLKNVIVFVLTVKQEKDINQHLGNEQRVIIMLVK